MKKHQVREIIVCVLLIVLPAASVFAKDTTPPTQPKNFKAEAISQTSVRLSWDASLDNKRVRYYDLFRQGQRIARINQLSWVDSGLSAATTYLYSIVASDGKNRSLENRVEVETQGVVVEPPPDTGAPVGWSLVFNDDFSGSGSLDTTSTDKNWRFESLQDALHRAGNSGMDEFGNTNVAQWASAKGKRWSAWYNQHHSLTAYRDNDWLVVGGMNSGEQDPTRPIDYVDEGVFTQYGSSKLYTAWIDTWARVWSNELNKHIVDPNSPNRTFKYGYFETRLSFSHMNTPGFRLSMWLMPATSDEAGSNLVVNKAYDADGNNGVELDIFEYEWIDATHENDIHLAVHGGLAGSSTTMVDASDYDIALHQGEHTIGFLWQADKLVWSIDGRVVKTVTDADLIPDVYSYLIISREMNSGVKDPAVDKVKPEDMLATPPYIPRDPGLYAKNIWEFRNRINTDQALIDYVRVWQP